MTTFAVGCLAGFLIGCCWEGCRNGGTIDLRSQLHQLTAPAVRPSNVRLLSLPRQEARR